MTESSELIICYILIFAVNYILKTDFSIQQLLIEISRLHFIALEMTESSELIICYILIFAVNYILKTDFSIQQLLNIELLNFIRYCPPGHFDTISSKSLSDLNSILKLKVSKLESRKIRDKTQEPGVRIKMLNFEY